jgi:hypothetical protein
LIYDVVKKSRPEMSFKSGMLYALIPVAIINNSIHGQFDSVFLFFLILSFYIREFYSESKKKYFMFGAMLALSFTVKPVSLIFLLLLFTPYKYLKLSGVKKYIINQTCSVAGLSSVVVICFSVFKFSGYNLGSVIVNVLSYSHTGYTIFGLPMAFPFNQVPFLGGRFWILMVLTLFSLFYYFGKIETFDMILFSFALTLGLSGLAPQYLIWIVPFLLIRGLLKFSAVYNLICTFFLMFYYMNPDMSFVRGENMATLSSLKDFNWLMPPGFLTKGTFTQVIYFTGNRLIPLCALAIAVCVVVSAFKSTVRADVLREYECLPAKNSFTLKNGYILFTSIFWVLIAIMSFLFKSNRDTVLYGSVLDRKLTVYDMYHIKDNLFMGNYLEMRPFNIVYVIIFAAILWGLYVFFKSDTGMGLKINNFKP